MGYTGRCACGAVTLAISAKPLAVRECWCWHCQQLCGGSPVHNAMFPTEAIATTGELRRNTYIADSGTEIAWEFCPTCGTPLLAYSPVARPHLRSVRLGAIDRPNDLKPEVLIWTSEAPAWAVFDPALPQFREGPPAPPPVQV